jgi:1-acyl-sn-glycerol-3-phosphate acyltransferase
MSWALGFLRAVAAALTSGVFAALVLITLPLNRGGILFHALARGWARVLLFICGVGVHVTGLQKLDRSRNYVYVSNHASLFDIPAVIAGVPDQIRIVYKKELERIPIFGWGLKWGSYLGIDRGKSADAVKSLEEAAQRIRSGASVLLFAEGTRTTDGKLQPFKRGAFNLAVKAGVPVVPLTVNGSYHILPKRSLSIRAGRVSLVLDSPIVPGNGRGKEAEVHLMRHVHDVIARNYMNQ